MKRIISVALIVAVCLLCLPSAFATELTIVEDNEYYTVTVDKTTISPGETVLLDFVLKKDIACESARFYVKDVGTIFDYSPETSILPTGWNLVISNGHWDAKYYSGGGDQTFAAGTHVTGVFVVKESVEIGTSQSITFSSLSKFVATGGTTIFKQPSNVAISFTIADSTPEPPTPTADGYTVGMPATASAEKGKDLTIPVTIGNSDSAVTTYNAYDMSFTFDAAKLEAKESGYPTGVTVTADNTTGTLHLQRFGDDLTLASDTVDLLFTVKSDAELGETPVTITTAGVDIADNAATRNLPAIDLTNAAVTTAVTVTEPSYTVAFVGNAVEDITTDPRPTTTNGTLTFEVNKAEGYTYTVSASVGNVAEDPAGTYTITGITGNVTVTVAKEAIAPSFSVAVDQYVELSGKSVYLITVTGDPGEGKAFQYSGNAMYAAANYSAGTTDTIYSYLVLVNEGETAPTVESATALVTIADGDAAGTITANNYDVNGTNKVDVNDAQLVYNIYTGAYELSADSMAKFLAADVNADKTVDVNDAVAVVAEAE